MSWRLVSRWPALRRRTGPNAAPRHDQLGDFTMSPRVIFISALALGIGVAGAYIAWLLLRLIGLFTNLFYYQRWGTDLASPADAHPAAWALFIPAAGGLVIGLMARYGSERIRGHGIPEAIEAILMNRSRVEPRVAVLKPLSSAISIGSGGPFGAEWPIIMTGGAFGSLISQSFRLTSAERKTLLVAGAAAGMSATFGTPVAAVLLAVELLLFEWKPRSLVPVALASAIAALVRHYLLDPAPLFPVPAHPEFVGPDGLAGAAFVGLSAGFASLVLTAAVYACEDAFHRLPIHWMWWPAIGGLAVGVGGLIFPEALGVGYGTIAQLLSGEASLHVILGVLFVKAAIWAISLGSGTSGGVLAPLLMVGGAVGALEGKFLPDAGAGFWPLIAMAAILGGTMRSPFTGLVFALELTHDVNSLLPLLVAVVIAHGFTVLFMKRSILTEKISRRGYHLGREYSIDPLELAFVRQVMRTNVLFLPASSRPVDVGAVLRAAPEGQQQRLYPVLDDAGLLAGVISRTNLERFEASGGACTVGEIAQREPAVAFPGEPLRAVAYRMAETGYTRMPVVDPATRRTVIGMVSLRDLLLGRTRVVEEEQLAERSLRVSFAPFGHASPSDATP